MLGEDEDQEQGPYLALSLSASDWLSLMVSLLPALVLEISSTIKAGWTRLECLQSN